MMTRAEAIKALERADNYVGIHYINGVEDPYINPHLKEAIKVALSNLRPVSRERVEKMKKEPVEGGYDELYAPTYKCPECGVENIGKGNFCRNCGCPHTDKAVDMVMERLEALHEAN